MLRELLTDGIPTLVSPAPGPLRAGLVFRVGVADEPATRRGITHLVEHLALFRNGAADYHYNGSTGMTSTRFHMQGSEADVVTFLNGVCASLRDLPLDRLATEKEILRTEAVTRASGIGDEFALWRYGAQAYGLVGYPEWGLDKIDEGDVRSWVASWFTRGNVALWLTGDTVPAGLELDLPDGPRRPLPAVPTALPTTPAYFNSGTNSVAAEMVLPRGRAARVYAGLLERRLFQGMRQDSGLSYTAATSTETWGGAEETVIAVADTLAKNQPAVVSKFASTIRRLSTGDIQQDEIDSVVTKLLDTLASPETERSWPQMCALGLLTGYPEQDLETWRRELPQVTVAEISEAARLAQSSVLFRAPQGCLMEQHGAEEAPQFSRFAVRGRRYRGYQPELFLIIAADGVSVDAQGGSRTVLFGECVAMVRWPDGARVLIGKDGTQVTVEPTLYAVNAKAMAALDDRVPRESVIDLPARDPQQIPRVPWYRRSAIRFRRAKAASLRVLQRMRQLWWQRFQLLRLIIPALLVTGLVFLVYDSVARQTFQDAIAIAVCGGWLLSRRVRLGRW